MKTPSLVLAIAVSFGAAAQTPALRKCLSKEAIAWQQQTIPNYETIVNEQFEIARQWSLNNTPTRNTYTIPVVFHVVYNTPEENLPDSVVLRQLEILNRDYARLNPDTVNMRSEFDQVAGSTQVRFILAGIDPNGDPTTGITRTSTQTASFGSWNALFGDFTDLEKVKSTADGGHDPWDQAHYLNIWVCDMSINNNPVLLGYATPPDGLPNWPAGSTDGMSDGVVIQYQCIADNNPNDLGIAGYDVLGRTAVHEVGHYLGLRHIWGDGDCTMDDGVDDTPDATDASQQDCDQQKNTCNADVLGLGDLHDMVENFMDYAAETCQNSFTQHQAALMHGVLENQRYDLVHNNPAGLTEIVPISNCYPNPTNGLLNISASASIQSITVCDLNGKQLTNIPVNASSATFNLNSFQNGIYLLHIRYDNGMVAQQRITKAQ